MAKMITSALVACLVAFVAASPTRVHDGQLAARAAGGNPSPAQITAMQRELLLTPDEVDRLAYLLPHQPDATNITYTFVNNTVQGNTGGTIALTTVANFPALVGTNVAMAIGFVNACGLNVPHNHPRANEFLTVIQGKLVGGLVVEQNPGSFGNVVGQPAPVNGNLAFVNATLTNYTGMLFPQGTTHFQFNPTCEPAIFAAAFDSNDPGRTQIARNFFSEPDAVIVNATGGDIATLDASRIAQLRGKIPTAFAVLMEDCAKSCGIKTS